MRVNKLSYIAKLNYPQNSNALKANLIHFYFQFFTHVSTYVQLLVVPLCIGICCEFFFLSSQMCLDVYVGLVCMLVC